MTGVSKSHPILAADVHVDQHFCYLTAVQSDQLIYAMLNKTEVDAVHDALSMETDGLETLQAIPGFTDRADLIPVEKIQSIEWIEGDPSLLIVFDDENRKQPAKTRVLSSCLPARDSMIAVLQQTTGVPFETSTAKEGLWRVAKKPLIWGGIFAWVFLGLGISGLMEGRESMELPNGGRRRALKELVAGLYNTIGPVGMCVIGAAAVLFAIFSIVNNYRHAPHKHIAKAQRTPSP